jgi:hypothetical protein
MRAAVGSVWTADLQARIERRLHTWEADANKLLLENCRIREDSQRLDKLERWLRQSTCNAVSLTPDKQIALVDDWKVMVSASNLRSAIDQIGGDAA